MQSVLQHKVRGSQVSQAFLLENYWILAVHRQIRQSFQTAVPCLWTPPWPMPFTSLWAQKKSQCHAPRPNLFVIFGLSCNRPAWSVSRATPEYRTRSSVHADVGKPYQRPLMAMRKAGKYKDIRLYIKGVHLKRRQGDFDNSSVNHKTIQSSNGRFEHRLPYAR